MRRFAFQLEKVLELREFEERDWEIRLAEVTGRVIAVEREISDWGRERVRVEPVTAWSGYLDMAYLKSREGYVGLIDDRVQHLQSRLVTLESEREQVRTGYLEASRRRKALSKLRERRSEEYYAGARREENRVLDEIGGYLSVARLTEGSDV